MKALNFAIDGVPDKDEQTVLALLAHFGPILGAWRGGEDLRASLADIEQRQPVVEDQLRTSRRDLESVQRELVDVAKSPQARVMIGLGLAMIVGGIVGGLSVAVPLFILPLLGAAIVVKSARQIRQAKAQLQAKRSDAERVAAQTSTQAQELQAERMRIETELTQRADSFPEIQVARVGFPVRLQQIVGVNTLLDESGVLDSVLLETIDLKNTGESLASSLAGLSELSTVPVLLDPDTKMGADDESDRLYGQEDRLRTYVESFVDALTSVRDVSLRLPLVPNRGAISAAFLASTPTPDADGIGIRGATGDANGIAEFVSQVNATRATGNTVLAQLEDAHAALSRSCEAFANARQRSMNDLHSHLLAALTRGAWCSRRFFCPVTIQSPKYLFALIGLDPADAHKLEFEELDRRLRSNPVIEKRVNAEPDLLDRLYLAHQSVSHFVEYGLVNSQQASSALEQRNNQMQSEFEDNLKQFRLLLNTTLTGAANPVLALGTEARLYYDPDTDLWQADALPYTYSSAQAHAYGQVSKVHSDLLMPLWDHLWTEKADFRKSELFRTNESLIRMSEKESEKLIEIGNQFRADMRAVRENVNLLEADLNSKREEVAAFRDGMVSLKLLSDDDVGNVSDAKLAEFRLGEVPLLQVADEHERYLFQVPKMQAQLRGVARDPIDLARSPAVLVVSSTSGSVTPLLGTEGAVRV